MVEEAEEPSRGCRDGNVRFDQPAVFADRRRRAGHDEATDRLELADVFAPEIEIPATTDTDGLDEDVDAASPSPGHRRGTQGVTGLGDPVLESR
jgi:hypothetical protein